MKTRGYFLLLILLGVGLLASVKGIPHVVLIDPQGVVRWEGYPLLTGHELTEKVVAEIVGRSE